MDSLPFRLQTAIADRYRIERELGGGGMATVYLAHDLKHDRDVALKVLRPELAAALGAQRFHAEATSSQSLVRLQRDPIYDPLRSDPRFIALMKRLNFLK